MLSWSSTEDGTPADIRVIASGEGDAGLPHGAALVSFAEAIARWDDDALAAARAQLVHETSEVFMIDAAAVAANFEMMTRIADGTGAKFPADAADRLARIDDALGIAGFTSNH